jgi:hypothetical protein
MITSQVEITSIAYIAEKLMARVNAYKTRVLLNKYELPADDTRLSLNTYFIINAHAILFLVK